MTLFKFFSSTEKDCISSESIKASSDSSESQSLENAKTNVSDEPFPRIKKRPSLVKQKHSFRYPEDENELEDLDIHLKSTDTETKDEGISNSNSESQDSEDLKSSTSIALDESKNEDGKKLNLDNDGIDKKDCGTQGIETGRQLPVNPFLKRISFEDLKEEVKLMPTFPPPDFVRTGSDDSGTGCSGTRPGSRAQTR